jgi:outer membrane receptor protein involved in Fe transport
VEAPAADTGAVSGRVTDKATGAPIVGATVMVEGTRHSATTASDGGYRIADVLAGTYTILARYIGYAPVAISVTVSGVGDATADFALHKSPQLLDEVVTTGTILPTEVKALPTPITVIRADEIAQQHPQALLDVIRQAIPTAVAFDTPTQPVQTDFSVRGASSLGAGTSLMKIFVDGIEATSFGASPVDPSSIERIEVVRGPQAATLYGADAAGGVLQIFTKRGHANLTRPQIDATAQLGVLQTPYSGYGGVLRQKYSGSVRGGGQDASYYFGVGYTRLADYLPTRDISRQVTPVFTVDYEWVRESSQWICPPATTATSFRRLSVPWR